MSSDNTLAIRTLTLLLYRALGTKNVQVAGVSFGGAVRVAFDFDDFKDKAAIEKQLLNLAADGAGQSNFKALLLKIEADLSEGKGGG